MLDAATIERAKAAIAARVRRERGLPIDLATGTDENLAGIPSTRLVTPEPRA